MSSPLIPPALPAESRLAPGPSLLPSFPSPARVRADFFDLLARGERHGVPTHVTLDGLTKAPEDGASDISLAITWFLLAIGLLFGIGLCSMLIGGVGLVMLLVAVLEFGFLSVRLRRLAGRVGTHVTQGFTLGMAMQMASGFFAPYEVELVRAAERGGRLAPALDFLGRFTVRRQAVVLRMVRAFVYPLVLLPLVLTLYMGFLIFLMPKFVAIVTELGGDLPPATRALVDMGDLVIHYGVYLPMPLLAAIVVTIWFRRAIAAALEYVPGLGRPLAWGSQGRFLFALGSLLDSRVPAVEAVTMAGSASGSVRQWRRAQFAARRIAQGRGLAEALEAARCLPPAVASQLRVAQDLRTFPERCVAMGDRLLEIQSNRLVRFAAILEPIGVVLTAATIGSILLGIYEVLFRMGHTIGFEL